MKIVGISIYIFMLIKLNMCLITSIKVITMTKLLELLQIFFILNLVFLTGILSQLTVTFLSPQLKSTINVA